MFDPVLCELVYRWFSAPGHLVLDPFAGGSVRGIVAAATGRAYAGIDLRDEQVQATGGPFEIQLGARSEGFYMAQFIGVNARYRASVVVQH